MQPLSPETDAPPALTGAEIARARLNRIAPASPDAERRARDANAPRRRPGTGKREPFRLGWVGWLVVDAAAVALILAAVLVWPPVSACRDQEAKMGFYAGDTLRKCVGRGVSARIDRADQRIKMAFRGSGR